jgi:type IV pilus assembly protein PilV
MVSIERSSGFSLVEVMVAVFVLTVSMLGVGALQITSKRTHFESVQRTTAALLAQELLERMRTNAGQLTVYTAAGSGRILDLETAAELVSPDCASATCSPNGLALYDLAEFFDALRGVSEQQGGTESGGLVEPTVCLDGPETAPGIVRVAIAWRGMSALADPVSDACGSGSGRYDSTDGVSDRHRRVLFVDAFVN